MGFGRYRFRRSFGNVASQFRGARPDTYPLFTGVLDDYPGAAAAYSLRALSSGWLAGDVVEVREDTGQTTQSFTASQILNGDLEAFCGAGNGYVSTWYDQSGNANDATQATTTEQPKIVDAGALVVDGNGNPWIDFDGVDDVLMSANLSATSDSMLAIVQKTSDTVGCLMDSTNGNNYPLLFQDGSSSTVISANAGTPNYYVNGSLESWINRDDVHSSVSTGVQNLITIDSMSLDADYSNGMFIYSYYTTFARQSGFVSEFIVWGNSSNRVGIETNINDYYSIYA